MDAVKGMILAVPCELWKFETWSSNMSRSSTWLQAPSTPGRSRPPRSRGAPDSKTTVLGLEWVDVAKLRDFAFRKEHLPAFPRWRPCAPGAEIAHV